MICLLVALPVFAYRKRAMVNLTALVPQDFEDEELNAFTAALVDKPLVGVFTVEESGARTSVTMNGSITLANAPTPLCRNTKVTIYVIDETSCNDVVDAEDPQLGGDLTWHTFCRGPSYVSTTIAGDATISIDPWTGADHSVFGKVAILHVTSGAECGSGAERIVFNASTIVACGVVQDMPVEDLFLEQIQPFSRPITGAIIVMAAMFTCFIVIIFDCFKVCSNFPKIVPYMNAFSLGAFISEASIYLTLGASLLEWQGKFSSLLLVGVGIAFIIHWICSFPSNAYLGGGVYHDPGRTSGNAEISAPVNVNEEDEEVANYDRSLQKGGKGRQKDVAIDPFFKRPAAGWPVLVVLIGGRSFQRFLDGIFIAVSFRRCVGSLAYDFPLNILYRELTTELCVFYVMRVIAKITVCEAFFTQVCISLTVLWGTMISSYTAVPRHVLGALSTLCGAWLIFLSLPQLGQAVMNTQTWLDRILAFIAAFFGALFVLLTNLNDLPMCMEDMFLYV